MLFLGDTQIGIPIPIPEGTQPANIAQMKIVDLVNHNMSGGSIATDEEYTEAEEYFQTLARKILGIPEQEPPTPPGPTVDPVFGNNTPDVIAYVSNEIATNGYTSAEMTEHYGWSLGDLVDITLTNSEVIQMQIIGVNHDTLSSDHTSKAGLTLQMKNCLNTKYAMNGTNTNAGGWNGSKMRTETMPTLLALLPSEWQAVIKTVDKKAANGGSANYTATVTSEDKLFLPAEIEVFGSVTYAQDGANEGSQYEFYANGGSKVKNFNGSASYWWERSSYFGNTYYFCFVSSNGFANCDNASYTRGVSFAFCI